MYKVMLVDDEPFILDGIRNVIDWEELNLEIINVAFNGKEALETLKDNPVHILLTDIVMPEIDGLQLVRMIRQIGMNIRIIILSGHDDFKYVKEAAKLGIENYLLKPVEEEELISTLRCTIENIEIENRQKAAISNDYRILKENILYRWATGNIDDDELKARAAFIDFGLDFEYSRICIFRTIHNKAMYKDNSPGDVSFMEYVKSAVVSICEETGRGEYNCTVIRSAGNDIVMLFSWDGSDLDRSRFIRLMEKCSSRMKECLKLDLFVSIGSMESGYNTVHRSYNNALRLLDYRLVMKLNTMIDDDIARELSLGVQSMFRIDFERLRSYISAGDKKSVMCFLNDVYSRFSESDHPALSYIQNMTVEILFNIISELKKNRHWLTDLIEYPGNCFTEIMHMKTVREITRWLTSIIDMYFEMLEENDINANPVGKRIIKYVQENYNKDISLKSLSLKFGVTSAYLGQLFKNTNGELFSKYLNRIRLEKAMELLCGTELKTYEIAERVGFNNSNYFANAFKKYTGQYPTEYRNGMMLTSE